MDLIYANEAGEDIGVLTGYAFDLAYGKDENDFTCTVGFDNHVCRDGYILYIEGTEYGGIIDGVSSDTEQKEIIYSGRTWHGILAKKILEPDAGYDYLEVSGDANEVLRELVERMELANLFYVPQEASGIGIALYKIRYGDGYSSIRKMLAQYDGKLRIVFKNGKVELSAVPLVDYSQDEEFDTAQIDFRISRNYRPVNHLICLGAGDMGGRHVLHLYTDENGGIQPYTKVPVPVRDEDYILNDRSGQKMFAEDEVAEVYDCPNAQSTVNYASLLGKPDGWEKKFTEYYERDWSKEGETYRKLEARQIDVYTRQTVKPSDWETDFGNYYRPGADGKFEKVKAEGSTDVYTLQDSQPEDWEDNYGSCYVLEEGEYGKASPIVTKDYLKLEKKPPYWSKKYSEYYVEFTDGTEYGWKSAEGKTDYEYKCQTMRPSDWQKNFGSYFKRRSKGSGYENVKGTGKDKKTAPAWKAKKYFTRSSRTTAPAWKKNVYYACKETESAPVWVQGKYYTKTSVGTAPEWEEHTYRTKTTKDYIPQWRPAVYYEKVTDHYAELAKGGIEILRKSFECDSIEVDFDTDADYGIGDIVGACERITGIEVWQPVSKKIVSIDEKQESIKYEIGE